MAWTTQLIVSFPGKRKIFRVFQSDFPPSAIYEIAIPRSPRLFRLTNRISSELVGKLFDSIEIVIIFEKLSSFFPDTTLQRQNKFWNVIKIIFPNFRIIWYYRIVRKFWELIQKKLLQIWSTVYTVNFH